MSHEHKCHAVTHCSAAIISMYSRGFQTFSRHGPSSKKSLQVMDTDLTFFLKDPGVGRSLLLLVEF